MINLNNIRNFIKKKGIYACLISKNNQFLNEITETRENFLYKITKFTGSLGYAIIFQDKQYLYVDGRYHQQARIQVKKFIIKDISKMKDDLLKIGKTKKKILIDPKTFSYGFIKSSKLKNFIFFNSLKNNNRKKENVFYLTKNFSGCEVDEKIKQLKKRLSLKRNEAFLITSPENIGWLSNIRSKSKNFSKILNCNALLINNKIFIFNKYQINLKIKNIEFKISSEFKNTLFKCSKIYFDKKYISFYYFNLILRKKIKFNFISDPIDQLKSIKNETEIANLKIAHLFDGIAYTKFLFWIKNHNLNKICEKSCQKKIEFFKKKNKYYLGPSFETISATEKNASIIHYNAKDFVKTYLKKNHLLLFDSGSQYFFGTTDMTRTITLGKQSHYRKKIYTLILKSQIGLMTFKIKKGMTGKNLDHVVRSKLAKVGLDYNHGTGHGVGYLSNVHEAPPSVSKLSKDKICPGQVISNEPGFYKKGMFGIRLENLIYLKDNRIFDNLTLVPFENSMIIGSMLTKIERDWINNYHEEIYLKIHRFLNNKEKKFLKKYCLKIN
tara:strand:+ start:4123 stop:5781 length:1659 start_codon:yes stop_codon:yes gene_type:complete